MIARVLPDIRVGYQFGSADRTWLPGDIELRLGGAAQGIAFRCPCGCGLESYLPIATSDNEDGWKWDGNADQPTLTPSVLNRSCGWHGYLRKGEWVSA